MTLQHILDHRVCASKQVSLAGIRSSHLLLERHRLVGRVFLSKSRDVPHPHSQVHRSRDNEVFFRVELGTPVGFEMGNGLGFTAKFKALERGDLHDVVVMSTVQSRADISSERSPHPGDRQESSRQDGDAVSGLPVPNSDRLVV